MTSPPRPASHDVAAMLEVFGPDELRERGERIARLLADDGVTYRTYGAQLDEPWSLDPIPLLLDEAEWGGLDRALRQRCELLDLVLADLYGPRTLIADGFLPPELVLGHAGFVRQVDQVRLRGRRQLFLAAADLARDADGRWVVLADRTQAPSGAGYAMENRRVVSRALPYLYRTTPIQRIGPFFHLMRAALQDLAPHDAPRVVLLTSGARSETAFDQAFSSSLLGFPLVAGSDLTVRDGRVWQRSIGRMQPVDVILRRVDSWFCDPLELRPESRLGVPGLVEAARLGNVAIVNGLGTGVLENPGLFPYLPKIAAALLGEELRLPSVPTWWCGDATSRRHVLANLERLVIKPAAREVSHNSRFGSELSRAECDDLRRRIEAEPHNWVGQELVPLGTVPTVGADGGIAARPFVVRTFAVAAGGDYQVLPGGLTRAAPAAVASLISNQHGAVSKDVWVLTRASGGADEVWLPDVAPPERVYAAISPRVAEDLFWLGRYAERAEDVARMLRITDNRWHDSRPDGDEAVARCLGVLLETLTKITTTWPGFVGPGSPARLATPRDELLSLLGDDTRTGTLAHDIRRLRELANSVRDQLSNDTWIVLGRLDRELLAVAPSRGWDAADDTAAALGRVLGALLAFAGLAAESMVRDTGWCFMDAGRRIERAQQVVGLLRATLIPIRLPAVDDLVVESVLIAAESIITHRRRYPARAGVHTVLELLLTDLGNPRSVAYQLGRLGSSLGQLPTDGDDAIRAALRKIVARVGEADVVALAAAADNERTELAGLLDELDGRLRTLAEAIQEAHFAQPAPPQPLDAILAPA